MLFGHLHEFALYRAKMGTGTFFANSNDAKKEPIPIFAGLVSGA